MRNIVLGRGKINGVPRNPDLISIVLEVMAALCLATDLMDLKERFRQNGVVAYTFDGKPVTAPPTLKAAGSMALLMKTP